MERLIEIKNLIEVTARDDKEFKSVSVQFDFDPGSSY